MNAKPLGFGLMRLPLLDGNDQKSIDKELFKKMIDDFIAHGFTYFDTAWMYHDGASEKAVKDCLIDRYPRDAFTLTSKLPGYKLKTLEDRDSIFNKQRERTGVEYFDYYLIHNTNASTIENFERLNCFDWIEQKKAEGLIKHTGLSHHDGPELLDEILTKHPAIEYVQLQINYLDWDTPTIQSRACLDVAIKHNKKVIVMEPVKGGTLVAVPDEVKELFKSSNPDMSVASWAVRFAAGCPNVVMVLSGMTDMAQLADNMSYMYDFKPLTPDEKDVVTRAAQIMNDDKIIKCTACDYCKVDCPANIPISRFFNLYNLDMKELKTKSWTAQEDVYNDFSIRFNKASACVECGACETHCPQHLPIRELLKEVAAHFEKN